VTPSRARKDTRRRGKIGTRPLGVVEEEKRVVRREEEYSDVLSRLDTLGDPFDDMNIEEKKRHALFLFYDKIKVMFVCLFVSSIGNVPGRMQSKTIVLNCLFVCHYYG
jgi:hypothetical protein